LPSRIEHDDIRQEEMSASPQILTLLNGLAGKAEYYVARMRPPASIRQVSGVTAVHAGIASDSFNCIVSGELEERDGLAAIAQICSQFNSAGLPAAWWTCDGVRADFVAPALLQHHFVEDETDVGMLAELSAVPHAVTPAGFEVRMVDDKAGVLQMGHLLASLADPPDRHTLAYHTAVSELEDWTTGAMRLFLGFEDGRAVSTGSLFLDGDTGHIFDVSTPSTHRGRGFGTAMMRAVLEEARALGARRAGLQASQDGLGVYRRLGFHEICTFRVYSNKHYIAGQPQG
jgi:ribosomal protein S18 acetylase RimI-like enzyme